MPDWIDATEDRVKEQMNFPPASMRERMWLTDITRLIAEVKRLRAEGMTGPMNKYQNILDLTSLMDKHPDGYTGPCQCKACMGNADE